MQTQPSLTEKKISYYQEVKKMVKVSSKNIHKIDSMATFDSIEVDRKVNQVKEIKNKYNEMKIIKSYGTLKADSQAYLDGVNKSVGATMDQNLSQERASTDQ